MNNYSEKMALSGVERQKAKIKAVSREIQTSSQWQWGWPMGLVDQYRVKEALLIINIITMPKCCKVWVVSKRKRSSISSG